MPIDALLLAVEGELGVVELNGGRVSRSKTLANVNVVFRRSLLLSVYVDRFPDRMKLATCLFHSC